MITVYRLERVRQNIILVQKCRGGGVLGATLLLICNLVELVGFRVGPFMRQSRASFDNNH